MAALDEVPQHLLSATKKADFVVWLSTLPIDPMAKRKLISQWRLTFHVPFSQLDYTIALQTPGKAV